MVRQSFIYEPFTHKAKALHLRTTREEAIEAGLTVYLGSVCKNGHDGLRYTHSDRCYRCESQKRLRATAKTRTEPPLDLRLFDEMQEDKRLQESLNSPWEL